MAYIGSALQALGSGLGDWEKAKQQQQQMAALNALRQSQQDMTNEYHQGLLEDRAFRNQAYAGNLASEAEARKQAATDRATNELRQSFPGVQGNFGAVSAMSPITETDLTSGKMPALGALRQTVQSTSTTPASQVFSSKAAQATQAQRTSGNSQSFDVGGETFGVPGKEFAPSQLSLADQEALARLRGGISADNNPKGQVVTVNGQPAWIDFRTGKATPIQLEGAPGTSGPTPAQQSALKAGQGPVAEGVDQNGVSATGQGQQPIPRATSVSAPAPGAATSPPVWGKIGGGAGGKQQMTPEQAAALTSQMDQADRTMQEFEAKYLKDPSSLGAGTAFIAGASGAGHPALAEKGGGLSGAISGGVRALGNAALSRTNPEYQEYLAAQNAFGDAALRIPMANSRYTNFRQQLESGLGGLSSGDAARTVSYKQARRREVMQAIPGGGATQTPQVGGSRTAAAPGAGGAWSPETDPVLSKYLGLTPP